MSHEFFSLCFETATGCAKHLFRGLCLWHLEHAMHRATLVPHGVTARAEHRWAHVLASSVHVKTQAPSAPGHAMHRATLPHGVTGGTPGARAHRSQAGSAATVTRIDFSKKNQKMKQQTQVSPLKEDSRTVNGSQRRHDGDFL